MPIACKHFDYTELKNYNSTSNSNRNRTSDGDKIGCMKNECIILWVHLFIRFYLMKTYIKSFPGPNKSSFYKMSKNFRGCLVSFLVFLPMIRAQNIPLWQDIDYNFEPLPLEGATYIAKRDLVRFEPDYMGLASYKRSFPELDIEDFMVKRSNPRINPNTPSVQYR